MKAQQIKVCVSRDVVEQATGRRVTGVFEWTGPSWTCHTIVGMIKELPTDISDKALKAAYTAEVKRRKAEAHA